MKLWNKIKEFAKQSSPSLEQAKKTEKLPEENPVLTEVFTVSGDLTYVTDYFNRLLASIDLIQLLDSSISPVPGILARESGEQFYAGMLLLRFREKNQ